MSGFAEEPRTTYSARMGKAEFFAWLQTREGGRYELKDGEIVVHAGSTLRHAGLSSRILVALATRLDAETWVVVGSDYAVEVGDDVIRYPDVVVNRSTNDPASRSTTTPTIVVEVLSPTSRGRDMQQKLGEYTSLPSLEAYIVASQDETIVWVWQRDATTRAFPSQPNEITGLERAINISALGLSLPLAEIYRGIISV